jgi:hypothetical protein
MEIQAMKVTWNALETKRHRLQREAEADAE